MSQEYKFKAAVPVWEKGTDEMKNIRISFVSRIGKMPASIHLTASCSFTITVNGRFVAHGPARTAHGFFRVDEIDLTPYLTEDENFVAVRVAGYYTFSFSNLKQPSFLCAEILSDDRVIAATGVQGFEGYRINESYLKTERYGYQRPYTEHYHYTKDAFAYESGKGKPEPVELVPSLYDKKFINRPQPYGEYPSVYPSFVSGGKTEPVEIEKYGTDRFESSFNAACEGFPLDEYELIPYREIQKLSFTRSGDAKVSAGDEIVIGKGCFADLEFPRNLAGLLEFDLTTDGAGELDILFDEFFSEGGKLDPFRMDCYNVFSYEMKEAGHVHVLTAEPYLMKAIRLLARGGEVRVSNFHMIKIAFPASKMKAKFNANDPEMEAIFDAAIETFSANAVDIYMDCPSRERAGWLCDSFFTSRVEKVLTGKSELEATFLENFVLTENYSGPVAEQVGMLPMCYPSDSWSEGHFIPNWAMWYVIELEEYFKRTGDRSFIDFGKPRMYKLLSWFRSHENKDGLLEKLPGWIFVEWSKANQLVQDINFPTNMVYAGMLSALGHLYGDDKLLSDSEKLKEKIRAMSMTESGFFSDNMVYRDGTPVLTGERTETCQYYAFYFGIATPETYPELWKRMVEDFGPERKVTKKWEEIYFANAFIGNYLRLELLCENGYKEELLSNIRGYFTYMVNKTGTLWENDTDYASCNHGFASHVLVWMDKCGLIDHN